MIKTLLLYLTFYMISCSTDQDESSIASLWDANKELPENLEDTYIFNGNNPNIPNQFMHSFDVKAPFWAGNINKNRFIYVPYSENITIDDSGNFVFPIGTIFVKHFYFGEASEMNRSNSFETRLIILQDNQKWKFATYYWKNDVNKDAAKKIEKGLTAEREGRTLRIPQTSACKQCHDPSRQTILGFNLKQLNFQSSQTGLHNLQNLIEAGVLNKSDWLDIDSQTEGNFSDPYDESISLDLRARTYLETNCASCHNPDSASVSLLDFRMETPFAQMGFDKVKKSLVPANPQDSLLFKVIDNEGVAVRRMPPGSIERDPNGAALIKSWIESKVNKYKK